MIAYLTAAPVLHKILDHLGLPTAPTALGPARYNQQLDLFDAVDDVDEVESFDACDAEQPRPSGRGPPASTSPPPETAADWVVEIDPQQTDNDWGA